MWLIACLILAWLGFGGALLSYINRGDFQLRFDKEYYQTDKKLERGFLKDAFEDDPDDAFWLLTMFFFVWPFVIYVLYEEYEKRSANW